MAYENFLTLCVLNRNNFSQYSRYSSAVSEARFKLSSTDSTLAVGKMLSEGFSDSFCRATSSSSRAFL